MATFSLEFGKDTVTRLKLKLFHVAELLNWVTQSSRLMVLDSSNCMTSLAGSGFKTKEDRLNIKIVTALLFIMPAHFSVIWKYVSQKNKLKIHPIGMANFFKGWHPFRVHLECICIKSHFSINNIITNKSCNFSIFRWYPSFLFMTSG